MGPYFTLPVNISISRSTVGRNHRFAKFVLALINALSERVGQAAIDIVAAMSGACSETVIATVY